METNGYVAAPGVPLADFLANNPTTKGNAR